MFPCNLIASYVQGIAQDREWADEIEMTAAERLFGRPVVVYNAEGALCRALNVS